MIGAAMSDEQPSEVLGSLPRTRPHRRSDKREVRQAEAGDTPKTEAEPTKKPTPKRPPVTTKPAAASAPRAAPKRQPRPAKPTTPRLRQPAQPEGTPATPSPRRPVPARGTDIVGTAVQAAAELAEIGLSLTARAVKGAVSRLPRP
jgi:outer membrane biosynthesis protein TonB